MAPEAPRPISKDCINQAILSNEAFKQCAMLISTIQSSDLEGQCATEINRYAGGSIDDITHRMTSEQLSPLTQIIIRSAEYAVELRMDIEAKFKGQEILRGEIDVIKNALKSAEHLITIYSTVLREVMPFDKIVERFKHYGIDITIDNQLRPN